MIKPSVGRVVLVQRFEKAENGVTLDLDPTQPEPALVTYVHTDRQVNVAGFTQSGAPFAANEIVLLQDDDTKPDDQSFAYWMDYQKAQASGATGTPAAGSSPPTKAA